MSVNQNATIYIFEFLSAHPHIAQAKIAKQLYTEPALKACARRLHAEPNSAVRFKQRGCARRLDAVQDAAPARLDAEHALKG